MGKTFGEECEAPGRNNVETSTLLKTGKKARITMEWTEDLKTDPDHLLQPTPNAKGEIKSMAYADALMKFKESNPSEADIHRVCRELSDVFTDQAINRWRNEKGGYNHMAQELGLAEGEHAISKVIGGADLQPEFRKGINETMAYHFHNIQFERGWKTTAHTITESASHAPNHAYFLKMSEVCDVDPQRMAKMIFGVELQGEDLKRFQAVTGLQFSEDLQQLRVADGAKEFETNFWHMVRIKWSKGEIQTKHDLARFTMNQIRRYT